MTANTTSFGAFSVSLSVKDLAASRAFYEQLGFTAFAGKAEQRWLILRNGNAVVGLFQGIIERNTLTFNPGWDSDCQTLERFDDVQSLQDKLVAAGVVPTKKLDDSTKHFLLIDPDGNPVLVDQHV